MTLKHVMSFLKQDLADFEIYLVLNCKSQDAKRDLLSIVRSAKRNIFKFDELVKKGAYSDALTLIAHPQVRGDGFYFKPNYDYDEGWNTILDDFRAGKIKSVTDKAKKLRRWPKKKKKKASAESLVFLDSYCDKKKNIEYWSEMKDEEYNEAVEDFINYIKEVECQ